LTKQSSPDKRGPTVYLTA